MSGLIATAVSRRRARGWRPILIALTIAILIAGLVYLIRGYGGEGDGIKRFADFVLYRDAGARWLGGGPFYLPHQLAGPYVIEIGDVLYPPPTLVLFALLGILPIGLAAVVWWGVPAAVIACCLWRLRPAAWSWPLLALTLWWTPTIDRIAVGNPLMWLAAAMYAATVFPGAAVLVALKPTLAPFALFRANHRSWWISAGLLAAVSLLFLPLWFDYLKILENARSFAGAGYSFEESPALLGAIVAFLARTRPPAPSTSGADPSPPPV
jgi:hypothetical protein